MATFSGDSTGSTPGVESDTAGGAATNAIVGTSANGYAAIYGHSTATANGIGIYGDTTSTGANAWGVWGDGGSGGGGVRGVTNNTNSFGVHGSGRIGVHGDGAGSFSVGVYGTASAAGVSGLASGNGGYGVEGVSTNHNAAGVYGRNFGGVLSFAGLFVGNVDVSGSLTKGGGGFVIDHPLDPANRYLEHSFVESDERKNVYDGLGEADENGELTIEMPAYFEALNENFRYQLTAIGGPAPDLHIKEPMQKNRFTVAGAKPRQEISWGITGVRKDAWAKMNPLTVECAKPVEHRGLYRHPEAHGAPASAGIADERDRKRLTSP